MNKSIGLFDSGVGGISILNSLVTKLPDENFIYLSDNKNCPYGDKSQEEITILSIKNSKKLIVKLLSLLAIQLQQIVSSF